MKKMIVFVCNGNIHRSVVAEKSLTQVFKDKGLAGKFFAASFGLQGTKGTAKPLHRKLKEYPKEYKAAKPTLAKLDININNHSYKKITPQAIRRASVIIAMDKIIYFRAKNSLLKQFPESKNKTHLFSELVKNHRDIKDPSGSGSKKLHRRVIQNIFFTIKDKVNVILKWAK